MSRTRARAGLLTAFVACVTHGCVITWSLIPGQRADALTSGDAITYLRPAENIVRNGHFSRESEEPLTWEPYRTPGYPLLIAGSIVLFDDHKWVLYAAAVSSGLAAWCVFSLTVLFGGTTRAARIAGALLSVLPNSLGLSSMMLTDAITGHLTIAWLYLLISGCKENAWGKLLLASVALSILQSFKPTFNIAGILVCLVILLYTTGRAKLHRALPLLACTLLLPMYFSFRNAQEHGVSSASLLGVSAVREYMQVRYLAETTGAAYGDLTKAIRRLDSLDAAKRSSPRSFYGRLYMVQREKVTEFFLQHPIAAARLMLTEMLQQFAAPQEFFPQVFVGDLPTWGRVLGSLLTLALWGCAFLGAYILWRGGERRPAVLLVSVLAFFLTTASVSHFVGARLRFPADVAAVPFAGIGVSVLLAPKARTVKVEG